MTNEQKACKEMIELNEEQVIGLINALESSDAMQKTIAVMFLKSLLIT